MAARVLNMAFVGPMCSNTPATSFSILSLLLSPFQHYWSLCCCTGCLFFSLDIGYSSLWLNPSPPLIFAQLSPFQWGLTDCSISPHNSSSCPYSTFSFLWYLSTCNILNSLLTCYLFLVVCSSPLEPEHHQGRDFHSLMVPACLEELLAHSRCYLSICLSF